MKRVLTCFSLVLLFLLACQRADSEGIRQILQQRAEALQKKDLTLYLSCISKSYKDKNENYEQLKDRIQGYFKSFDRIDYSSWDRTIRVDGESATVIQQFHLEVEKEGRRRQYAGKELLFLEKEGSQWRIMRGL
jgi:ketosteroid isomerase-like protein